MRFCPVVISIAVMAGVSPGFAQVPDFRTGMDIEDAEECLVDSPNGSYFLVRQTIGPSFAWAHTARAPNGAWLITYGPSYFDLPPLVRQFTSYHECGHAALNTDDEIRVSCYALEELLPDEDDLRQLEDFFLSVGSIGEQYGGSGDEFWRRVRAECPEEFVLLE